MGETKKRSCQSPNEHNTHLLLFGYCSCWREGRNKHESFGYTPEKEKLLDAERFYEPPSPQEAL